MNVTVSMNQKGSSELATTMKQKALQNQQRPANNKRTSICNGNSYNPSTNNTNVDNKYTNNKTNTRDVNEHKLDESNDKKNSFRIESMKMTLSSMHPKRCKLLSHLRRSHTTSEPITENEHGFPIMDDSSLSSMDTSTTGLWKKVERAQEGADSSGSSKTGKQNVGTLDLFKYANLRERLALGLGALCMLYAASWQPISVFILATMATLMGDYSRRIELLNGLACLGPANSTHSTLLKIAHHEQTSTSARRQFENSTQEQQTSAPSANLLSNAINNLLNITNEKDGQDPSMTLHEMFSSETSRSESGKGAGQEPLVQRSLIGQRNDQSFWTNNIARTLETMLSSQLSNANEHDGSGTANQSGAASQGEEYSCSKSHNLLVLEPVSRLITPLLWPSRTAQLEDAENIKSAVAELFELEDRHFLRSSFELNASAFVLAQTQLISFFIGISLIAWAARQQASRVKCLFFESCLQQEVNWFESRPDDAAGLGSSLNTLVAKYEDGIGIKLALLVYFIGHIVLFAMVAFWQMANLAAFCMPFVLLVWLVIVCLSNLQSTAIGQSAVFAKRSLQLAEEIINAIRTVCAFNAQQCELKRFQRAQEPVYRKSLVKHFYTALNTSLSKFSIFACFSFYCFYASRLFPPASPGEGPKNRAAVLALMRGAEVSIVNILISIPFMEALQQSRGCIACVYQIMERKSRIDPSSSSNSDDASCQSDDEQSSGRTESSEPWDASLSFERVHFSYSLRPQLSHFRRVASRRMGNDKAAKTVQKSAANEEGPIRQQHLSPEAPGRADVRSLSDVDRDALLGTQQQIISGLSFDVKPGQSVALVGPSGAGKSTVLALVQRLYDVTEGRLLVGRRDIRNVSPGWLRNQIGIVTQEPRLFDLSISENIRLGLSRQQESQWDGSFIQQQVVEAATQAGAHNFIIKLPMGYETRVGSGGVQLSGGQKQRIAIARALIRRPKLLLLDECTSALDSESEAQVQVALRAASSGTTTLIVAHHLATVKHCDLIVVMDRGSVVERGSHKELVNAFGLYRRLWDEQSRQRGKSIASLAGSSSSSVESACVDDNTGSAMNQCSAESDAAKVSNSSRQTSACSSLDLDLPISGSGYSELVSSAMNRLKNKSSHQQNRPLIPPASDTRSSVKGSRKASEVEIDEDVICELNSCKLSLSKPSKLFKAISVPDRVSIDSAMIPGLEPGLERKFSHSSSAPSQIREDDKLFDFLFRVQPVRLMQLLRFIELPACASVAGMLACLLAGLILPMNLIAHSYLFAAFAYKTSEELGHYITTFGIWALSFSALVFLISFGQIVLPGYVGELLSMRMRCKIMQSLLEKPIFYFDLRINSAGALVDRFNTHISNIQSLAGSRIATLLEACSTLVVSGLFGFVQSASLSLFCLTFALIVLCTTMLESRLVQLECERERQFDEQAANLMADALSNIKTITSLNGESFFIERFSSIMADRRQRVCPVVLFAVNDTFRALVFLPELLKAKASLLQMYQMHHEFSALALKTQTLGEQLLDQSALVAISKANDESSRNIGKVNNQAQSVVNNDTKLGASRFGSIFSSSANNRNTSDGMSSKHRKRVSVCLNLDRRVSSLATLPNYMNAGRRTSILNSVIPKMPSRGRIEFKNVDFAYPNRPEQLVLDRFTLSVAPGECVALVGGSGSGKSSTVALLEKFYDYHSGQVSLDGQDLRLVEANWVRSQIGLVSQEPTLFSCSIADNIRYGDNCARVTMEQVVEAARAANIHEYIMSLPEQYDTQLSAGCGSRLSGGQKQRIAIARALIRRAPILILDEATSALDTQNESYVQDAMKRSRRGRTSLIIAHRLANIKDADKIVVMRNGRIVEVGTHFELLRSPSGRYRTLWQQQEAQNWSSG